MESEHPESQPTDTAQAGGPAREEGAAGPPDPAKLVARLIEAGDWPEPALFEQLIAAGDASVGPLLEFMRTYPDPEEQQAREMALYHGLGVLGAIRSTAAIPVLVEIIRRYPAESGEEAARVLGEFREAAFEPAMELVKDPALRGYPRHHAITAAIGAAGADPARRTRLADAIRPMLADAMDRTREIIRQRTQEAERDDEEPEDIEGEDEGPVDEDIIETLSAEDELMPAGEESNIRGAIDELEPSEELWFLVDELSSLADPQAQELLRTAFSEDLVDTFWIDEKDVERRYGEGGSPPRPPLDWLEDYRREYQRHLDYLKRPRDNPLYTSGRPSGPEPTMPAVEPIRNTGPKVGRNDPCWCGSGKKYKKCHLGKDGS